MTDRVSVSIEQRRQETERGGRENQMPAAVGRESEIDR